MPESYSPAPEGIFCLRCRYELRGLTSRVCPECGRPFNPERSDTFSRFASRQSELAHALRRAVPVRQGNVDAATLASSVIPRLWEQIAHLVSENIDLRATVHALGQVLIDKGILEDGELRQRLERLDLFDPRTDATSEQDVIDWLDDSVDRSASNPASSQEDHPFSGS